MKLELNSSIDSKKFPETHKWDEVYRKNFELYQQQIDALTYALQRSQRGFTLFGSSAYPNFHQKNILKLNIYKKKQQLGEIFQNEVDAYKPINENIVQDLNNTFSSSYRFPTYGLALGLASFPVAHYFNFQYSFRVGFLVLPIAVNVLKNSLNTESYFKTLEFLDFAHEMRKGKAALEHSSVNRDVLKKYKEMYNDNKPVKDRFQQLVELVKKEN